VFYGFIAIIFLILGTSALADTIVGQASVIDGDTIEIHGERIRILDVDAPENQQLCTKPNGTQWRCGQQSALRFSDWIAGRSVVCESDQLDRYGRHLARCVVSGEDMGTWLVRNGWAVPYRDCKCEIVREASVKAQTEKLGIWSGSFVLPWDFRRSGQNQAAPSEAQTGQCLIKGNINSKGDRIYHVPGSRYYDKTKINETKGERWFCSEAEAIAAGWRAPR